jgi:hypothetical protein
MGEFVPYRLGLLALASAFALSGGAHAANLEAGGGFRVGVSLDLSQAKAVRSTPGAKPAFSVDAGAVSINFSYLATGQDPAVLSNIGIYVTLESRLKRKDDKQADEGVVLATFGCGVGGWPQSSAIPKINGRSCNDAPLAWSNYPEAKNFYPIVIEREMLNSATHEIIAVVNVNYMVGTQVFRTSRKIVNVLPAPNPSGLTPIPGRRFEAAAAYVDDGLKFDPKSGAATIDPNGIAVWLRSAGAVSDVEVLADFRWGKDAADAAKPGRDFGMIGCAVGPLEAGQATAYQGVSCNLPAQALTVAKPPPGGKLFARYSVSYPQANVCWSELEEVRHITTDGTVPARLEFDEDKTCLGPTAVIP